MTKRSRAFAIGVLAAFVVAGGVCAALVEGIVGELLTIGLIAIGLAGALLLVFVEIGLGEERDLARDEAARRKRSIRTLAARQRSLRRPRRRPD